MTKEELYSRENTCKELEKTKVALCKYGGKKSEHSNFIRHPIEYVWQCGERKVYNVFRRQSYTRYFDKKIVLLFYLGFI